METYAHGQTYRVELFGGLRVFHPDGRSVKFRTRKTAALFAYLAHCRDTAQPREVLVDMFWPESNLDSGRQSLRMALSALRSTLEPDPSWSGKIVDSDRTTVRLRNVVSDVAEFEGAIEETEDVTVLARALKLVKGPLLSGFDDSWIVAQWLRLEEAYAQAAVRLMELSTNSEDRKRALIAGKEAAALLGPREDVHLALMRLCVADGQPAMAIAQFEELERLMDEQWGEAPSDAAYDALDSVPKSAQRSRTSEPRPVLGVPARTSTFLGREQETAQLVDIVASDEIRLVTVFGPGGCGKTALAVQVGRVLETDGHRVAVCELASISSPDRILESVLASVSGTADLNPTMDRLASVVGDEPLILVLDNFEHLLPKGSAIVKSILESLPTLRVVVTSRVLLGLDGEQAYSLRPLQVPRPGVKLAELREVPSVVLFVDRAKATRHDFKLSADNAVAVSEICRRLEGLPLAIELAAARIVTHTPAQILAKLVTSLDFLVSRKMDVDERQKSLRATLEWSLGMLDQRIKAVFASLGIFRGGFSLEAGEAVAHAKSFDEDLSRLIESSLVLTFDHEGVTRFRLLEPVREYAWESVNATERRDLRLRHFSYFLALAQGQNSGEPTPGNKLWLDTLHLEHDNLVAAFECVFDKVVTPLDAIGLVSTCRAFFRPRGHTHVWREAVRRLAEFLDKDADLTTRAKVQIELARLSANVVDAPTMRAMYDELLRLGMLAEDDEVIAHGHHGLGGGYKLSGEYQKSVDHYLASIEAFKRLDDEKWVAMTIRQLAMAYVSMGDHEKTYETLKEAIPYARRANDPDTLAWCLTDVGVEHALHGLVEESRESFAEAHEICKSTNNAHMRSIVYWQQGETELRTGRPAEAVATHRESVKCALAANFKEGLKWILLSHGAALVADGQTELGLKTLARTMRWRSDEKRGLTGDELEIVNPAKESCEKALGPERFKAEWAKNETCDLDELIESVLGT